MERERERVTPDLTSDLSGAWICAPLGENDLHSEEGGSPVLKIKRSLQGSG